MRKYDASGAESWTRQFGLSAGVTSQSASVDVSGNVYIAGNTSGTFPGQTNAGGADVFVRKYDPSGSEAWTRQLGTSGNDLTSSVGVDVRGNVYVAGYTLGAFLGHTNSGDADAFLVRFVP